MSEHEELLAARLEVERLRAALHRIQAGYGQVLCPWCNALLDVPARAAAGDERPATPCQPDCPFAALAAPAPDLDPLRSYFANVDALLDSFAEFGADPGAIGEAVQHAQDAHEVARAAYPFLAKETP